MIELCQIQVNPQESIDYSIQVVVSFDENLSEDDHLFDVNCRFGQFENIVGTFYEVGQVIYFYRFLNETFHSICLFKQIHNECL